MRVCRRVFAAALLRWSRQHLYAVPTKCQGLACSDCVCDAVSADCDPEFFFFGPGRRRSTAAKRKRSAGGSGSSRSRAIADACV